MTVNWRKRCRVAKITKEESEVGTEQQHRGFSALRPFSLLIDETRRLKYGIPPVLTDFTCLKRWLV